MASIKDALEEALNDDNAMIKYFVFAIPVFYCVYLYSNGNTTGFWWMALFTALLLFGFLIDCTTNVRNGKDHVLPSYNIFALLFSGLKGIVAIGPCVALCSWIAYFVTSLFTMPEPNLDIIMKSIIWAVFIAVMLTSYLLYSQNFKISDAYNFKTISEYSMDILVAILFFIPQILIVNGVIVGGVSYGFWIIFGLPNIICTFFWCMALIFNLAIIGNYLAQVDYEAIESKVERD